MGSEEDCVKKQICVVNPTVPDDEPTSSTVVDPSDNESRPSRLASDMMSSCVETKTVVESHENLLDLPEDVPCLTSSSSSEMKSEEGEEQGNNDTSTGTDSTVVQEICPSPLPSSGNTSIENVSAHNSIESDEQTEVTSAKVHSNKADVTNDNEPSAATPSPQNHSPDTEESTYIASKTDNCIGDTSALSEKMFSLKCNSAENLSTKVMIQRELGEKEILVANEICTEALKEIYMPIKHEAFDSTEEQTKMEILHRKEDFAEMSKVVEISVSEDSSSSGVPLGTESINSENNPLELTELNNNVFKDDPCKAESENEDNSQLFEGPIGYGTDLDDSPPMKSMAYGCGICYSIVGYTRESFNRHQKNYHWISLQCKVCKKTFATTKGYENHMTSHIRYPCLHCPKEFKHLLEVEDHQGQHFSNKLIRCERCGEEFYLLATLNQHHFFMGKQCIEIQKNVRRIQEQLKSPLNNEELVKYSKGKTSQTLKRGMEEHSKNHSDAGDTSKSTVQTRRRSKRVKYI